MRTSQLGKQVNNLINREALWSILLHFGFIRKFVTIFCLLHSDIEVMVITNGFTTDTFPIWTSVKQGCIITPTLVFIYLAAMLHLTTNKLLAGVELTDRICGKLFNFRHLQAKTKVTLTRIIQQQCADDACLCAITEDVLQIIVNTFTEAYESMGLNLNICCKTM
eukprot:g20426.t1